MQSWMYWPIEPIKDACRDLLLLDQSNEELIRSIRDDTMEWRRLMSYYRCAIMAVDTKFRVLNDEFSLQYDRNPIESIKTRLKSADSIVGKLRKKGLPLTLASLEKNLFDVAGVRVVCSFPEDIYMLADCLLQQDDVTLVEIKDYINEPKPSGYRSLHLIVEVPIFLQSEKRTMKVEVQLRTIAMEFWASLEHKLHYKTDIPEPFAGELVAEMRDISETIAQLDSRMEEVRRRIEEGGYRSDPGARGMQGNPFKAISDWVAKMSRQQGE